MRSADGIENLGTLIAGRYRVEQLLGRGGTAAVYRVLDERSGQRLALKRGWAREPDKQRRQAALLEREFHTLAQLAHPGIIEVYDYGVDEHVPYYTMELLEGGGLDQRERLDWREASAVLSDVASALAILHSRGLLHRDVSLRNVHYATHGRIKLIDFGAMVSMGVAKDIAGTAPFLAPEVLQQQALDARVDLFALGALGYRLLTGRNAYDARRISELRDRWRSRPTAPAVLVPEVPAELSSLILRMLALDRAGRPQHVAEVIQRLRAIAGLPPDDAADVTSAYLTTPVLVGRDAALLDVRRQVLSLLRGDGGLLLVRGAAGSGRSRLLDACALEGKLLGASVLRADARDATREWGVARELGAQLLELLPEHAAEAARLHRNVLGEVLDLGGEGAIAGVSADRSLVIRELRDWILELAKLQRLAIVVDDVDRIDDPSRALLSALAHRAERHPILLALAVERSSRGSLGGALRLLDDLGTAIELEDLSAAETEALMRSLFGDVPNLPLCAARIHGLSHGNPRAAMELAEHLIATRRARYEAGHWTLPSALDERDLPTTLSASLAARLAELNADARELAVALALADADALTQDVYPALTEHGDAQRVFRALDALVSARVLRADSDRYTFVQRGFLAVLEETEHPEQRRASHLRIALALAERGDPLRRVYHLLEAGLEAEAVALLSSLELQSASPPLPLLKRAIAAAERLGVPALALHRLRMALLIHAPLSGDHEALRSVYAVVLRQLEHDTGLARYRALDRIPETERLGIALTEAQQAYERAPEHERVYPVVEAVRELSRLYGAITAMAANTFDLDLLESLPALEPLFPLSAALPVMSRMMESGKEWIRGRVLHSRAMHTELRARLAQPDRAGFDESQHERARLILDYSIGLIDATLGIESAEAYAKSLEAHRATRVNAWRLRAILRFAIGDVTDARACARRAELLEAQEGLRERYGGSTLGIELGLYSRLGDLLGVKGLLERLAVVAARHRGWRPVELLARGRYAELQGDPESGLRYVEQALAETLPLRQPFYPQLVANHVRMLTALGRIEEAVQRARAYVAVCLQAQLHAPDLAMAAALALGRAGNYTDALVTLAPAIVEAEQLGRTGLGLGVLYEARARLAIGMRDREAFAQFAQRCASQYAGPSDPALGAQLGRLYEEAEEAGVYGGDAELPAVTQRTPGAKLDSVHSRMAECVDAADRGRCALTLLLQATHSPVGYLFVFGADRSLKLLAALPDAPSDRGIAHWAEQHALAWSEAGSEAITATATISTVSDGSDGPSVWYRDSDGHELEAVMLRAERAGSRVLSAVLVLDSGSPQRVLPSPGLCASIARELLDYGDATGRSAA